MARNNFQSNANIELDGIRHQFKGRASGRLELIDPVTGDCFCAPDENGVLRPITDEQFEDLLRAGRAKVLKRGSADPKRAENDLAEWTIEQASLLDPQVPKKLVQCQMLDDVGVPNGRKAIAIFLAEHWKEKFVAKWGDHDAPATIERWRIERGHPGCRHAAQMVNMTGKVERGPYCTEVVAELLQKNALARIAGRLSISGAFALFQDELRSVNAGRHPDYGKPDHPYFIPSYATFRRRCNALEQSETVKAEKGGQAVLQDWMGGGRSLTADFAMQRVIIDHTRLDLFVIYKLPDGSEIVLGRPWLTLAIDVATRAIVAHLITFIPPCVWTVGETISRMAMPKHVPPDMLERYPFLRQIRGRPVEIIVDNAVEFRGHTMEAAARSAGFSFRFCPIKRPRYRGIGERAMGTVNRLICADIPGRTIPIQDAKRLGYDAAQHAIVFMDELESIAIRVVAILNTEPHAGIDNRQPALVFQRDAERNGINNFIDLDAFRRDLMAVKEKARLSNSGIVAFGLRYHGYAEVPALLDDLRPIETRRQRTDGATATVDFRYDPLDISRIHVWNRRRRVYVELRCSDERYADGMPLFVHDQIREFARNEGAAFNTDDERAAARGRLLQMKLDIDPNERNRIHEEMARLYDVPRVRQITGSIAKLELQPGQHTEQADFVGHDRAALTNFDNEILSIRAEQARRDPPRRRERRPSQDVPHHSQAEETSTTAARRRMPRGVAR